MFQVRYNPEARKFRAWRASGPADHATCMRCGTWFSMHRSQRKAGTHFCVNLVYKNTYVRIREIHTPGGRAVVRRNAEGINDRSSNKTAKTSRAADP